MTSCTLHDDNDTSPISSDSFQSLHEIEVARDANSEATPDKSKLGNTIIISATSDQNIHISYDLERESRQLKNRIANIGLPQSSTTTQF